MRKIKFKKRNHAIISNIKSSKLNNICNSHPNKVYNTNITQNDPEGTTAKTQEETYESILC